MENILYRAIGEINIKEMFDVSEIWTIHADF